MAQGSGLAESAISRVLRYKSLDNVPLGSIVKITEWLKVSPLDLYEVSDEEIEDEE